MGTGVGVTVNVLPEQIVAVCALTFGVGLTGTVNVKGEPGQTPAVGVIIYTAVFNRLLVLTKFCVITD